MTLSGTVVPGVTSRTIDAGLEANNGHSALMGMAMNGFSHNNPGDITIMVITPTIEERP